MKKLLATVLTLICASTTYALPLGNPAEASLLTTGLIWEGGCCNFCDPCASLCDMFSVRLGFYGDYVFNRYLEGNSHSNSKDIEDTEFFTNAGYLALNFCNRIDLFATLGATNWSQQSNIESFIPQYPLDDRLRIEMDTAFSWSLGLHGTIWECGCTTLGIEAQYFHTHSAVNTLIEGEEVTISPPDLDAKYHEWQVGVGLAHRIHFLVPYVGIKWSRGLLNYSGTFFDPVVAQTFSLPDQETKKDFGFAVGVTMITCDLASLTVEGRFGDEKAVYVLGQVRF